MSYYENQTKFLVSVDCVIFGYEEEQLKLLVYPRAFEPVKGSWSLMGGFVKQLESAEEAAYRVLQETTGLSNIFLEQVSAFSGTTRDPFERVISVVYFALIRINQSDEELIKSHGAKWWPVTSLPKLIFDHREMVERSMNILQQKAGSSLIGTELLQKKFTFMQLRKLYEAIYQREFDPGNFRKKILSLGVLEKLDQKNSTESKKGAYYYRLKPNLQVEVLDRIVKI
ncbi:NUDIX domain-containing protein [Maribellus comscasis]|uniref:NUDIX domain-containing protein n=1 Tax=Maribellus comscasis TaxID=2681766 RepID=A0A6I6JYE6_9BACT|nr:NUDIX domain-containing protein [Maribellus comscasis]QGY46188.1 NUDIX domain-containing protein [Maribellus comscasis]